MDDEIKEQLRQLEAEEGCRILYACESGSRAWGFASSDSDYDVRFIYVRPVEWYLSIQNRRDVIERPLIGDLDINGWDLRKALQLFRKSNPPLLEWLGSPTVYVENGTVAKKLRELGKTYYSKAATAHHYLAMARGNYREYLKGETVSLKKYLYVLRPLLAVQWIEREQGTPPTDFNVLVDRLIAEPMLRGEIDALLEKKRAAAELDRGPRIEAISTFIDRELDRWEGGLPWHKQLTPVEPLDELFREIVMR